MTWQAAIGAKLLEGEKEPPKKPDSGDKGPDLVGDSFQRHIFLHFGLYFISMEENMLTSSSDIWRKREGHAGF